MDRSVDIYVHEADMARMERTIARSHFLSIVLLVILLATNIGWLYYESSYTDTVTTVTQELDSSGGNAIINDGVHLNGEDKTDSNN